MFFFPAKKAQDVRRAMVPWYVGVYLSIPAILFPPFPLLDLELVGTTSQRTSWAFLAGKISKICSQRHHRSENPNALKWFRS